MGRVCFGPRCPGIPQPSPAAEPELDILNSYFLSKQDLDFTKDVFGNFLYTK